MVPEEDSNFCTIQLIISSLIFGLRGQSPQSGPQTGFSLNKNGEYGILFSVITDDQTPQQIPVFIDAYDSFDIEHGYKLERGFWKARTKGNEIWYMTTISASEFSHIKEQQVVSFTELLTSFANVSGYHHIQAVHAPAYDATADGMWRQCAAELP